MRKLLLSFTLLAFIATGWAQNSNRSTGTVQQTYKVDASKKVTTSNGLKGIELTPLVGYQLNGRIDGYKGRFKMNNAMNYGVALSAVIRPQVMGELSYSISPTDAYWSVFNSGERQYYDMNIHYFQLGGIYELKDGPVKPFGLLSLGATWFDMGAGVDDHVSFSGALGGGLKLFFSDHIGIRLQGRLLLPMYFSGGGLFVGIGSGGVSSGVGLSTGVLTVQGDISGGLIFRF